MNPTLSMLAARVAQLIVRAVAGVLVTYAGYSAAQAGAAADVIAAAAVALLLAGVDLLIHRVRAGKAAADVVAALKLLVALACVLTPFAAAASGCGASSGFYNGVRTQWDVIGPEYRGYVTADPTLGPPGATTDARTQILRSADVVDALIAAEGKRPVPAPTAPTAPASPGARALGSPVPPPPPAP